MAGEEDGAGLTVREAGRRGGRTTAGRYGREALRALGAKALATMAATQVRLPRLAERRAAAGLAANALAVRAGVAPSTVRRIEAGYPTRQETGAKLAAALGVGVGELRA